MSSHTPGPWIAESSKSGNKSRTIWAVNDYKNLITIAAVLGCGSGGRSHTPRVPEWKQNAALIVAAPDMYKFIKEMHGENCCLSGIGPFTVCELIAKAEGRL